MTAVKPAELRDQDQGRDHPYGSARSPPFFQVPSPWSSEQWAVAIKKKVQPFLRKSFPSASSFQILLDGEPLLHASPAKKALKAASISILPGWPKYSPDLNPQEHVWAWAEPHLRTLETGRDSFKAWQPKVLKAVMAYPSADKLVPSMARRCQSILAKTGAMLDE